MEKVNNNTVNSNDFNESLESNKTRDSMKFGSNHVGGGIKNGEKEVSGTQILEQFDMTKKYRIWSFTNFGDKFNYNEKSMKFFIQGYEKAPTTGNMHWQGYVIWTNARYRTGLIKEYPGVYWTPSYAQALNNEKYCKKDGNYEHFGSVPKRLENFWKNKNGSTATSNIKFEIGPIRQENKCWFKYCVEFWKWQVEWTKKHRLSGEFIDAAEEGLRKAEIKYARHQAAKKRRGRRRGRMDTSQ